MGELFEHFKGYDIQATRREARAEGEQLVLIRMVCKKLAKGKTTPQIAEELEEDVHKIEQICKAAETFDSKYNEEDILNLLMHSK